MAKDRSDEAPLSSFRLSSILQLSTKYILQLRTVPKLQGHIDMSAFCLGFEFLLYKITAI